MNHWPIMPILIPAVTASLLILTSRFDIVLSRIFCTGANALLVIVAAILVRGAELGDVIVYELGDWPAPFGIVLVVDRLTALMLLLTAGIGLAVSVAVIDGEDNRGRYFHALLLFQLLGINGAFLTGDLFNLFVFFEVMLLASYGLAVHGGGAARLRAGVQFVVINLLGSTLFLVGASLVYGVCGSLNLSDLSQRILSIPEGNQALLNTAIALLLGVFAIKAALLPFHVWLPATYAESPPLVAALFAITTKVGLIAMLRLGLAVHLWDERGGWLLWGPWIVPAALATLCLGAAGVAGAKRLSSLAGFALLASVGTLGIGIGLGTYDALVAMLYYAVHSTMGGSLLFMIVALVQENRGRLADQLRAGAWPRRYPLIAAGFLAAAVVVVGLPPLSGFIGKLLVLQSSWWSPSAVAIWTIVLLTSWLILLGFARAGILLFWSAPRPHNGQQLPAARGIMTLVASATVLIAIVVFTIQSQAVIEYLHRLVEQLQAASPAVSIQARL